MKNKRKKKPKSCEEWFEAYGYYYTVLTDGESYLVRNSKNQKALIFKGDMIAKLRDWDESTLNAFFNKKHFPAIKDIDIEDYEKYYDHIYGE
jgi:hypothetical protein